MELSILELTLLKQLLEQNIEKIQDKLSLNELVSIYNLSIIEKAELEYKLNENKKILKKIDIFIKG